MNKPRILFFAEARTLAHLARPYLLARSLDSDLYEIHFACSTAYERLFDYSNLTRWQLYSLSPTEFGEILERGGLLFPKHLLLKYVEDDLRLMEKVKPDVVVGDLRLSLGVSAPFAKLPYISLTNAYWSPFALDKVIPFPSFAMIRSLGLQRLVNNSGGDVLTRLFQFLAPSILAAQGRGLNEVRKLFALSPFPDYRTGFTFGDFTLYADTPTLVPTKSLSSSHRYIGPICWSPRIPQPEWDPAINPSRPTIYVSLGSSGCEKLLPRLIEALSTLDVNAVVASGGALPAGISGNVYIADYLPGESTVARARAVISNGGSPSTYQALSAGVPVLGLPSNVDQLLSARCLARSGAGISIRADTFNAADGRQAVTELLSEHSYRQAALRVADECASYHYAEGFAQVLKELFGVIPKHRVAMG